MSQEYQVVYLNDTYYNIIFIRLAYFPTVQPLHVVRVRPDVVYKNKNLFSDVNN